MPSNPFTGVSVTPAAARRAARDGRRVAGLVAAGDGRVRLARGREFALGTRPLLAQWARPLPAEVSAAAVALQTLASSVETILCSL